MCMFGVRYVMALGSSLRLKSSELLIQQSVNNVKRLAILDIG